MMKEILEQYIRCEDEIARIERKLKYYENNPLVCEHGVAKGSAKCYPYQERHFTISAPNIKSDAKRKADIQQLLCELYHKRQLYNDMQVDVDLFIEGIPDQTLRQIFDWRYRDGEKLEVISHRLGYDRSTVGKRINAYLESCE